MPVSTIAYIKEKTRQEINEDSNFLKRMLYFFELKVPAEVGILGATSFLYPLIIPPESYSMEEPFSVEVTPTQGGGLYVEENGIVQRSIKLRGHTGFKPRNPNTMSEKSASLPPEKTSYGRKLPELVIGAISGQRHFHYLQDSIFRTYGDLKRDSAFAKDTALIFHNPHDDEHWLVVPQRFMLTRDSNSRFLYHYDIELLVVDKAEAVDADFSEDLSFFEKIKNTMRLLKSYADLATGAINDITAMVSEIKSFVKDIGKIIDSVTAIVSAVNNFIDGVTELVEAPYAILNSTIALIEEVGETISESIEFYETVKAFPDTCLNKFRQIVNALEGLGSNPANWETPAEAVVRGIRAGQNFNQSISATRKAEALASAPPTTFDELNRMGTKLTPGDALSSQGTIEVGAGLKKYRSSRQVTIGQGETLVTLAARYLGDARLWQHLAITNGLKPPFVDKQSSIPLMKGAGTASALSGAATGADESPFDGTLGIGKKILIPSAQKSALDMPVLPVMGVGMEEPPENHFLGSDLKLAVVSGIAGNNKALYDIPIASESGSIDVQVVKGLSNLIQVASIRLLTERGTDVLYKRLGIQRIVGLSFAGIGLEEARFRIREAVEHDPRISGIKNLKLSQGDDSLLVDFDIVVRGLAEQRTIQVTL